MTRAVESCVIRAAESYVIRAVEPYGLRGEARANTVDSEHTVEGAHTMDRHAMKRVRLSAAVFLSAGAASFAAAAPASAATPVIMPPSISCQGVVSAINGSGFDPGALVQVVEPITGVATPPIPASVAGTVGLPSFTIPGAQYLPGSQFILDVLQSSTKVGTFPVKMPNVCPSVAPFQGAATTAPAVASSSASASASSTEAVSAPTQAAATPSFTAGSGSTGDDAAMRHTSSSTPLVVGAVLFAGLVAAAGAVSLRKGRVSQ